MLETGTSTFHGVTKVPMKFCLNLLIAENSWRLGLEDEQDLWDGQAQTMWCLRD